MRHKKVLWIGTNFYSQSKLKALSIRMSPEGNLTFLFFKIVMIHFIFSLMEALQTGSAFSREQKRKRGPRIAGGTE